MSEKKSLTGSQLVDAVLSSGKPLPEKSEERVTFITHVKRVWEETDNKLDDIWLVFGRLIQALFFGFGFSEDKLRDYMTDKETGFRIGRKLVSWTTVKTYWSCYQLYATVPEDMKPLVKRFPQGVLAFFAKKARSKTLKEKGLTFTKCQELLVKRIQVEDKVKLQDTDYLDAFIKRFLLDELGIDPNPQKPVLNSQPLDKLFETSPFAGIESLGKRSEILLSGIKALFRLCHHYEDTLTPGKKAFLPEKETAILDAIENAKAALESLEDAEKVYKATKEVKKAVAA